MAWTTEYRADRRNHHHRCRCCWKVIAVGERATFFRPSRKRRGTWAIHEACARARHSDTYTWAEVIAVWESDHPHRKDPQPQEDRP